MNIYSICFVYSLAFSYAASYLLENQVSMPFSASFEAARLGRSGADCSKVFSCKD